MISVKSKKFAPLEASREQANFKRFIENGVIEGFLVKPGSTNFRVNIDAGYLSINGIIIHDDAMQTDAFDFGGYIHAMMDHHIVYVHYDPDVDAVPYYGTKSGNIGVIAELTAEEAEHSVVLADIWIPNGGDAVVVNRNHGDRVNDFILKVESAKYEDGKLKIKNGRLTGIPRFSDHRIPLKVLNVRTESLVDGYYEIDIPRIFGVDSATLVYAKIDWADDRAYLGTVEVSHIDPSYNIFDEDFTGEKFNYKDTILIAMANDNQIVMANGVSFIEGEGITEGLMSQYNRTISSTAYSTSVDPTNADIDIDDVIVNIETLRTATLDTAYDGFELGSADGSGRAILADAGPVEINGDVGSHASPTDPWMTTLRIGVDPDPDNRDIISGLDIYDSKSADLSSEDPELAADFAEDRSTCLSFREVYSHFGWYSISGTPIDQGTRYIKDWNVELSAIGNSVKIDFNPQFSAEAVDTDLDLFVELSGVGGSADSKIYKLHISEGSFYLRTTDGVDSILSTYPSDFGILTAPISATATIWNRVVKIGSDTKLNDLEVNGSVTGDLSIDGDAKITAIDGDDEYALYVYNILGGGSVQVNGSLIVSGPTGIFSENLTVWGGGGASIDGNLSVGGNSTTASLNVTGEAVINGIKTDAIMHSLGGKLEVLDPDGGEGGGGNLRVGHLEASEITAQNVPFAMVSANADGTAKRSFACSVSQVTDGGTPQTGRYTIRFDTVPNSLNEVLMTATINSTLSGGFSSGFFISAYTTDSGVDSVEVAVEIKDENNAYINAPFTLVCYKL